MYGKGKIIGTQSDGQSKEKLAMYVYEYLVHMGAQKTAHSFLQEIRWDKSITVSEPPGFLHSWWSVFWDLYSAAPERRDTHEHSNEAKAFHDYGFVPSGYPNGIMHEHCMPNRSLSNASFLHRVPQSGHPGLAGSVGGGPPGGGLNNMPPSLGPSGPDSGSMRQRPSIPPMLSNVSGAGGPGSAPNLGPNPQSMHPSMRFHQPGGGSYGPVPSGMIPGPHPGGGLPTNQAGHPVHGPLSHHLHPSGSTIAHGPPSRARWMGPCSGGPPIPGPQGGGNHPVVCSNIGPMTPQTSSAGGIAPSPGHPGTPGGGGAQVAVPSPGNNGNPGGPSNSLGDSSHQSGHPHHPTPPHYAPQQQTPPASSGMGPDQVFSSRSTGQMVVGVGGPGGCPQPSLDSPFCGGPPDGLMNGGSGGGGPGNGPPGSNNPGRNAMMPPPPPEYGSCGLTGSTSTPGSYASDMKMSPIHGGHPGDMLSQGGGSGGGGPNGPGLLLPGPPDFVGGGGPGSGNFGGPQLPPDSLLMPSSMQQSGPSGNAGPGGGSMLHGGSGGNSQQGAPPPPQYMPSHQQMNQQSGSHPVPCGGPVQFPQEYSFNPISQ